MQDDSLETSTSISQLLRESYLAETKHQGRSERSRSEPVSHNFHYGNASGDSDEVAAQDDLPDLSAFLSQEELNESVNLARQAIDQNPLETKLDELQAHSQHPPENAKGSKGSSQDLKKHHLPSESESKKEFLNKAADFIEELSSLFKAHNSERIRPRTCKNYKSKIDSKNKSAPKGSSNLSLTSENRERLSIPTPPDLENKAEKTFERTDDQQAANLGSISQLTSAELKTESESASVYSDEPLGQPPRFTQKLKSREVPEGSKVQLDCIVVGIPAPEVRWYCEGKELENSPDIQIIQTGDRHSLIIVEAFEEDTGRYSCFASNIYGTDSTSAEIYIEGNPTGVGHSHSSEAGRAPGCASHPLPSQPASPTAQSPTNYLQGLDGRPIIAAPVFTKMLQDISASEGQLVVFECRVKGAPSPKVEWYREGTLIEDSPDFRILQKKPRSMAEPEEICTLVIAEVFSEDSGSFTCTASNKYGTVSSIARLTVKAPEDSSNTAALHTTSSIDFVATEHQAPPQPPSSHQSQAPRPKLEGVLVNHNEPRSSSKAGLRVHFKLPEDEKGSESSSEDGPGTTNQSRPNHFPEKINGQPVKIPEPTSPSKEPPPVLAKPKLDQSQLKQLHNQVLLEQQQVHQASLRELSLNTTLVNSATSLYQQSSSVLYKQSSACAPPAFAYGRPKQLLGPQTPPASPSASSSGTFSCIPPAAQRTNHMENLTGNPPRSSGGQQSVPSPKEVAVPPLTLPACGAKQFQPQSVAPAPLSPTARIQNPVAFLSAVLPSLPAAPSTNAMGLPRKFSFYSPTQGLKKNLKPLPLATEDSIRENKVALWGSAVPLSLQEYRISSFEQRLMNEIEFRLERTPVDESDDEVQHEEIPTGKYIAPIFDKRLKHFRVMEGFPITFTCKIVGIPIPKVYWFKDGKQISKKNTHFKMNREEDGTCSLHIEAATNDDDGNYTIMAANPQGRISCSGHLMVQSVPFRGRISTTQPHRTRPRVPEGDKEAVQERFFRPYFLQAPGDMVAHEGRLCRLDCKVSGLPTPELTWLLNGKAVLPDGRHKMLVRETGVHSLLIDPLSQSDAGTYTCLATNKTGQNSFSLELTVVAKEVKRAPMFLEKLQNCGVPEGYPVRLECRVVGMPPPIFYWKKDNETIPSNRERMSMHQDTTGYVCLLIQPAKKADAGWYTLSAKNEAGIVSCTARLDIYAQWHRQIPQALKLRPGGSRYSNLSSQGLDIFSAFPAAESPVLFSSPSQKLVESEEL
uniref:Myopalladin n=1 Tax=Serinus canaria TaxID=9135 RepID=A0A8C9NEG1_SERCA